MGKVNSTGSVNFTKIRNHYQGVSNTKGVKSLGVNVDSKIGTGVGNPVRSWEHNPSEDTLAFFNETEHGIVTVQVGHHKESYFNIADYGIEVKYAFTERQSPSNPPSTSSPERMRFFIRSTRGEIKLHCRNDLNPWGDQNITAANVLGINFAYLTNTDSNLGYTPDNDEKKRYDIYNVNTSDIANGNRTLTWGQIVGSTPVIEGTTTSVATGSPLTSGGTPLVITLPAGSNGNPGAWVDVGSDISLPIPSKDVQLNNPPHSAYPKQHGIYDSDSVVTHFMLSGLEKITYSGQGTEINMSSYRNTGKNVGKVRKIFHMSNTADYDYLDIYKDNLCYAGDHGYTTACFVLRVESYENTNFETWCDNFISTYGYPTITSSQNSNDSFELDNYSLQYIQDPETSSSTVEAANMNMLVAIFYGNLPNTAINNVTKDNVFSFGDTTVDIPGLTTDNYRGPFRFRGYSSALYFIIGADPDYTRNINTTRIYQDFYNVTGNGGMPREVVSLPKDDQYKSSRYCTIGGIASRYEGGHGLLTHKPAGLKTLYGDSGSSGQGSYNNNSRRIIFYSNSTLYKADTEAIPEAEDYPASITSVTSSNTAWTGRLTGDSPNPATTWGIFGSVYWPDPTQYTPRYSTDWHIRRDMSPFNLKSGEDDWTTDSRTPAYFNLQSDLGGTHYAEHLAPEVIHGVMYTETDASHPDADSFDKVVSECFDLSQSRQDEPAQNCTRFESQHPDYIGQTGEGLAGTWSWDTTFGYLEDLWSDQHTVGGHEAGYYLYPREQLLFSLNKVVFDNSYWQGGSWDPYITPSAYYGIGCDMYAVAGVPYPSRYNVHDSVVVNLMSFAWDKSYHPPNRPAYQASIEEYNRYNIRPYIEHYGGTPPIYENYWNLDDYYFGTPTGEPDTGQMYTDLQRTGKLLVSEIDRHYDGSFNQYSFADQGNRHAFHGAYPNLLMQPNVPVAAENHLKLVGDVKAPVTGDGYDPSTTQGQLQEPSSVHHILETYPTAYIREQGGSIEPDYTGINTDGAIQLGFAWRIVCVGTDPLDDDCPIYEVYVTEANNIIPFETADGSFLKPMFNAYGEDADVPLDWEADKRTMSNGKTRIEHLVYRFKPMKHTAGITMLGGDNGIYGDAANMDSPDDWKNFAVRVRLDRRYPAANVMDQYTGTVTENGVASPSLIWQLGPGFNAHNVSKVEQIFQDYPDLDKSYPATAIHYGNETSIQTSGGSTVYGKDALLTSHSDQHSSEQVAFTNWNSYQSSDQNLWANNGQFLHGFESITKSDNDGASNHLNHTVQTDGGADSGTILHQSVRYRAYGGIKRESNHTDDTDGSSVKAYRLGNKIGASIGGRFFWKVHPNAVGDSRGSFGFDKLEIIDCLAIEGLCPVVSQNFDHNDDNSYRIAELHLKTIIEGHVKRDEPKTFLFGLEEQTINQHKFGFVYPWPNEGAVEITPYFGLMASSGAGNFWPDRSSDGAYGLSGTMGAKITINTGDTVRFFFKNSCEQGTASLYIMDENTTDLNARVTTGVTNDGTSVDDWNATAEQNMASDHPARSADGLESYALLPDNYFLTWETTTSTPPGTYYLVCTNSSHSTQHPYIEIKVV